MRIDLVNGSNLSTHNSVKRIFLDTFIESVRSILPSLGQMDALKGGLCQSQMLQNPVYSMIDNNPNNAC